MFADLRADPVQIGLLAVLLGSAIIYAARFLMAKTSVPRSLFKTLPVVAMAGLSLWGGGPMLLTLALVLSAIGDYFLSLDEGRFIAGLSAFLVGHLAYIVLFFGLVTVDLSTQMLLSLGIVLLYGAIFARFLWHKTGRFRVSVLFYISVIMVMVMLSLQMPAALRLITFGALVFAVSDSVLAIRIFALSEGHPRTKALSVTVWWTYIIGQFAILVGVVGA